jgi:aminoglycoside 3-N-acetyltransferase
MENRESFIKLLEIGNVKKGELLMVHSSYSSIKNYFKSPNELLELLLDYLGPDGTLIIPTFNFTEWSNNHYFDIVETPSEMGVLTEIARSRKDGVRTKHPIYSFMVFGKMKDDFLKCNDKEAFGNQSVFSLFHKLNGNIMSIGLDYNSSFTLTHYVELNTDVGYRRVKDFSGIYVDQDRKPKLMTYSMLVRATFKIRTMIIPALEKLQEKGVIQTLYFNNSKIDFSKAIPFFSHIQALIISNPEFFHTKN